MGPVLRLSGFQRSRRLDAHVERRRCDRRVSRDRREEGQSLLLSLWLRRSAHDRGNDHRAVQNRRRDGAQNIHHLSHTSWPDRATRRGQVGEHPVDAGPSPRADAVLLPHQGKELSGVSADDGAAHQFVQQHGLCGRRWQHCVLPRQLHSSPRHELRLDSTR